MDEHLNRQHLGVAVELVERTRTELDAGRPRVAKHLLHLADFYLQCAKMEPKSDHAEDAARRREIIPMLDEVTVLLGERVARDIAALPVEPPPTSPKPT